MASISSLESGTLDDTVADTAPPQAGSAGDRLSVLHVLAPAQIGGLERVVHALAAGHMRRGHRVTVLASLSGPRDVHPFTEGLREAGVDVREAWVSARAYRRERAAVAQICLEVAPHVVHTHGYRPDVVDGGVARRMGVPVLSTSHGFIGGGWRGRLYEAVQRRAFRRFDAVVAVSRPMRDLLIKDGVPSDRIEVLPNAWPEGEPPLPRAEARRQLGIPEEGFQIGWIGRASPEKGPEVLVEALRHVADLSWQASIIGGGPMVEPIREGLTGSALDNRVRLHGGVPDAGRLLSAFDLFVLSSRTEGTPIVLFEAMAAGCDIVATRVGGVPDVVSDTEAILVAADDPQALGAAIRAAITDSASAAARSAAATRRLESFRLEPWLDRYEELYRRLAITSTSSRNS